MAFHLMSLSLSVWRVALGWVYLAFLKRLQISAGKDANQLDLPTQSQGFRQLSSWLQDLSLIGARGVSIEKAQIWAPPTEGIALKQPLLTGNWSAEIPLGLAPDLVVPPFASVNQMKTTLGNSYQLSGNYYVRADTP
jgi:hypothetical protein